MRALVSLLFLSASMATPAAGGQPARTSGDPVIDAQWAAQLRPRAAQLPPAAQPPRQRTRRAMPAFFAPQAARPKPAEPARPREMDPAFLPAVVDYTTSERPGAIVIDPHQRFLYLVLEDGKAQRYGVGVGRDGFGWSGTVRVGRKAEWPRWTPPPEMRKRQPYLPVSMEGGPNNPLGARALYLHEGGRDTLFRIHGSNEPWTIGRAVSSGCFRMRNEDVIELYKQVGVGTRVVVL
jgi:lipoprotein-anchoring transpeptidase ErfK/SrfK